MIPVPISRPPAFLFPRAPPPACAFHIFDPPSIFSPGPAGNEKNASHLINFCALEPAKVLVCAGRTRRRAGGGYRRGYIAINGGEEKSRVWYLRGRARLLGWRSAGAGGAGWWCLVSAWLTVLAACCLPCAWAGVCVCSARWRWCWCCSSAGGSGLRLAGMLRRRSAYPGRHTRPTPPRLAPAPVRACPSCRRAPAPPSPDGPPKTATARRRGYLPRPVSSLGKLCLYAPYSPPACAICTENRHGFLCKNNSQPP